MSARSGVLLLAALAVAVLSIASWSAPPATEAGGTGNAVSVAAGGSHTCALLEDGGMRCWGANDSGQLGAETLGVCEGVSCSVEPVAVAGLPGDVEAAALGRDHTCAVVTGNDVYCWGSNSAGQLGTDAATTCGVLPFDYDCSATPLLVDGLADVVDIGAGEFHTCALLADGGVRCWGENENGQLGDGTTMDRDAPVAVEDLEPMVGLAVGAFHTCAIDADGGVWCWGKSAEGQLGGAYACDQVCPTPMAVAGVAATAEVSAAGLHTCARTEAGAALCWGFNFDGQVGDGTFQNVRTAPTAVSGLSAGVLAIDGNGAFSGHTCAITTTGLVCWGDNNYGQLGDGSVSDRYVPVAVGGPTSGVSAVAAGYRHTCAIATTGLLCWGANGFGQLGDGTTEVSTGPVGVTGLSSATPGDANCDGMLTSVDAALILQVSAALFANLPCPTGGDANRDGAVTAVDAALVLQFVAGLLVAL